ncbi:hypothetical protein QAD02_012825 [Eretmocerus hayati]|uniref:Uncharacterized protein n=1 Tax=Eretmocerus hayati TaxID=131215 RepID=A0ACC2P1P5_9HYME|nr:hypothetical protein QAD02_012825 [Eretmocerus hayati]
MLHPAMPAAGSFSLLCTHFAALACTSLPDLGLSPNKCVSDKKRERFWIKERLVTKEVYEKLLLNKKLGGNIRKLQKTKQAALDIIKHGVPHMHFVPWGGRRIMHPKMLGQQLSCKKRYAILSILDLLQAENKFGIKVIYQVSHFDANTKALVGTLNAGMGVTHLKRWLAELNIPGMSWSCYKTHEVGVGEVAEQMAQGSCIVATPLRRQLTFEITMCSPSISSDNTNWLGEMRYSQLPFHCQESIPWDWQDCYDLKNAKMNFNNASLSTLVLHQVLIFRPTYLENECLMFSTGGEIDSSTGVVWLAASLDVGWFTRSTGSAKGMEPAAAAVLIMNNPILKLTKVQIGIFTAANDNSSVKAVQSQCGHGLVKLGDKNHTSDGFIDESLFDDLDCLFNTLASNVNRYVAGGSSNADGSSNVVVVSKTPESRVYAMTYSGDFRVSCAIIRRNGGGKYAVGLQKNWLCHPDAKLVPRTPN